MFVTPCFLRADALSSSAANANILLLITSLEVLSFYAGRLCISSYERFSFLLFSACL